MRQDYDMTEPLKVYNYFLKEDVHNAAEAYFDGLVQKNNVDPEYNRQLMRDLTKQRKKIEQVTKKLNGKKGLRGFVTFCTVLFFVIAVLALIIGIINWDILWWFIFISIGGIALGVLFIILIKKVINKKIKAIEAELAKLQQKADEILAEAKNQMEPLNSDYDWNAPAKIFDDAFSLVKFDQYFDQNKFYYLRNKYGFKENEDNISTLYIQSGSILGNPFLVERNRVREIRNHTYTGSITIHWTTVSGSGKNRTVHHHSETLTASVTKPRPEYFTETWLVYGNEAAPRLSFSRQPCAASSYDEKKLKKYVENFEKDFDKKIKNAKSNAKPITMMANTEFEALFGATNRDNDVEYRLLFTPLAQKNMIDLVKHSPFGDDFRFIKDKELNYIMSSHMQSADIDTNPERFRNYDHDAAKKFFIDYVDKYFAAFYFDLAPLMSIPLYQMHQSFENIFKGTVDPNVTSFEAEMIANHFSQDYFKHKDSSTEAILKRTVVKKNGNKGDLVNVHAYSYQAIPHTDYISKLGGDGRWHEIPVLWYEYIPLEQVTPLAVQTCQASEKKFRNGIQNQALRDFLSRLDKRGIIIYQRGLISFFLNNPNNSYNEDELDNYIQEEI